MSRSSFAPVLRALLVLAVVVAGVVGIVGAWQNQGGAPLGVIVATVLFFAVFGAGGIAVRRRSRGTWWGALIVLSVVLMTQAPSTEWLALPMIAMAAATESFTVAGAGAIAAVVVVTYLGVGDQGATAVVIFACAAGLAMLAGLSYRRLTAAPE